MSAGPVALSWSGGKDASLSLLRLEAAGGRVAALLSTFGADRRSSGHGVGPELLAAQADALGIPLATVTFPDPCPNEVYEATIAEALARPPLAGLTEMAFGDLFLEDHREFRTEQMARAGWTATFPVWSRDTTSLAGEMLAAGIHAVLVAVDTEALDASFLGRPFDERLLADLPDGVDPCAETGEFHTFVTDHPRFAHPVPVEITSVTDRGRIVFADLVPA